MLREMKPFLLFFSKASITPNRVKCLNKVDNPGAWTFISMALESFLSALYFSMLCAVCTSTVAHPLIVLSTWLH